MINKISFLKGVLLCTALLFSLALPTFGQTSTPVAEVFGGYSFTSLDGDGIVDRQNTNGFGVGVTGNLNRYLGLTGDFSFGWGRVREFVPLPITVPINVKYNTQTFLFGPTVSPRGEKTTVFGHALFGGMRGDASIGAIPFSLSNTKFAMGFGGGVDINLNDRFAIRAFQADYIPVRTDGLWNHNYRFQTGVVLRLGSK